MNRYILSAFCVSCLFSCSQNMPSVYGKFEEKTIAMPAIGCTNLKDGFRAAGWRVNIRGANIATRSVDGVNLIQNNGTSRYTLEHATSKDGYNFWTGRYDVPVDSITIYDNKTGEEKLSYSGIDILSWSSDGVPRIMEAIRKNTK